MDYRVSLSARAESDIYEAFELAREAAPDAAERWLYRLFETIFSLEQFPTRCPRITESKQIGRELRQLVFGRRSGAFRIIFDIQEIDTEFPLVRVLRVWRGTRSALQLEDVLE